MSNSEKRPTASIATTAFLILILSTTEMPPLLKYPMLAIATISFIIVAVHLYHEFKSLRPIVHHQNQFTKNLFI